MKRLVVILLLILVLSGCSNNSNKFEVNSHDDILLFEASRHLRFPEAGVKEAVTSNLKRMSEESTNPKAFEELANLIENDKLDEATALYIELGGEPFN